MTYTRIKVPAIEPVVKMTRIWGGKEYPADRWEEGFSENLQIETILQVDTNLPPVVLASRIFQLTEYPVGFLSWLEANSPLEGADEFAAYLSAEGVSPWFVIGHDLDLTPDGHLVLAGVIDG